MRLILTILLILITPAKTFAAEDFAPLDLRMTVDTLFQLDGFQSEKSKNDYIRHYYDYCTSASKAAKKSTEMRDIMKKQCTCTAAKIQESMKKDEIAAMFNDDKEADFQYARMLLIAYSPCIGITIKDIVFQECIKQKIKNKKKICNCRAGRTAQSVYDDTEFMIPGFGRYGFQKSKSVADPLGHILASKNYNTKTQAAEIDCNRIIQTN